MELAASCCFTALSPLPRQSHPNNGIFFLPSNSVSRSQLSFELGLPFRAGNRFGTRKSSHSLRISCIDDSKAGVVTGKSWDKLILKSETPVLVEFYTSWCGPCRMVHRVIDEIANDYLGRLNCFLLDADKDTQVAENYDIKAVPVVLLFKNGEKHDFIVGTMPKEFYVAAIERVLAS